MHGSKLTPLLNSRSVTLLLAGVVPFMAAVTGLIDTSTAYFFVVVYLCCLGTLAFLEYLYLGRIARCLRVELEVSNRLFSDVESEVGVNLTTTSRFRLNGIVRLVHPDMVNAENLTEALTNVQTTKLAFKFRPTVRGSVRWDQLHFRLVSPLKLLSWQLLVRCRPKVSAILPNYLFNSKSSRTALRKSTYGDRIFSQLSGEGREFYSLREYEPGDDLRFVDWKRSAKRNSLLLKEFRPESHQKVVVAIDSSARMSTRVDQRLLLDYAADAAARLTHSAIKNRDEVGLFVFNNKLIANIRCNKGSAQESRIISEIQAITPGDLAADFDLLRLLTASTYRRSLLVLITSIANPATLDSIRRVLLPARRKHFVFVAAIADRGLEQVKNGRAENMQDAYVISAAYEQFEIIQKRTKILKGYGIECAYTDATNLPDLIERKYHEFKISGRL